ncbi:hypothetical protein H6G33_20730 [Calothrix sp. FACHB-1219]|uniref:hypothetical protein n=1 Tax=unclassified Calothrix TaxID=2619626 RepID=UPI00168822B3|nr:MULTISPECIES: hypothetical protein [unclassified Calothrix]MBD2206389.1 hypothetical protein [Calothrix sp. FACHB-168]MBD2219444.1 hypothetical protein [Calothrix sp. FACHB-1219]
MVKKTTSCDFLLNNVAVASSVAGAGTLQQRTSKVAQSTATMLERVRERTDLTPHS